MVIKTVIALAFVAVAAVLIYAVRRAGNSSRMMLKHNKKYGDFRDHEDK